MMEVKKKAGYVWVVIGLSFLMVFVSLGFCSSNKSLYLAAITEALNIKRSLFSINDSIRYITTAVVNLFFGALVSKFGSKKLILAGFVCLMASCLCYAIAETVFVFYIGGFFLGLGLSWTTTTMAGCIVNQWCDAQHAGKITGAILAANGVGAAIATQILSPIIYEEGNPFGYRNAYLLTIGFLFVTALIIAIFYREKQKEGGDGPKVKKAKTQWEGLTFEEAKKCSYFIPALLTVFLTGVSLQGGTGVATAHMKDVGLDPAFIAAVFSLHAVILTIAKLSVGTLHDKIGLSRTLLFCDLMAAVVLMMLANLTAESKIMATVYSCLVPFALPLETIMLPLIAGDLFGRKDYNKLLGIVVSVNTAGYAAGPPLTNIVFDRAGTYKPILMALSVLMIFVAVISQITVKKAAKLQEEGRKEAGGGE